MYLILQLGQILTEKYTIPIETSSQICNSYLKAFRECPDNPEMELDPWREYLWSQALGDQYRKFSGNKLSLNLLELNLFPRI